MTACDRPDTISALTDLVTHAVRLGAAWARHGLAVGSSALRAAAETLDATSDLFGKQAPSAETALDRPR